MSKLLLFAVAATGPLMINIAGYDVPILAALTSVVSVILASIIAPRSPLSRVQNIAMVALLCLLTVDMVISSPDRSLILSTAWAVGIGYSGLPFINAIKDSVLAAARGLTGQSQTPEDNDNV